MQKKIIAIIILLSLMVFSVPVSPLYAQDNDLTQIANAYRNQVNWTTYHASASTRQQMAFSLEAGEIRFEQADTTISNLDASYDLSNGALAGTLESTISQRVSAGGRDATVLDSSANVAVINVDDTIYIQGEISDAENDYNTPSWAVLDPDATSFDIADLIDNSDFRDVEAFADVIEETGTIVSSETVNIRQYDNDLTYYLIELDTEAGLEVLNIDFENLLVPALENEFVEEAVFWERAYENSELRLGVFLDSETGALVAENIILTVNVQMDETDMPSAQEEILLVVDYSYEWSNLYTAVNEPVTISEPDVE